MKRILIIAFSLLFFISSGCENPVENPSDPTDTENPSDPVDPDPENPVDPTDPVDPGPVDPTTPVDPRQIEVSDHITLFFTNPGNSTSLETALIERIDAQPAGTNMDLCFYGFNLESLIVAIENAIARGVHVRFVGNRSGSAALDQLQGDYYEGYHRIAVALDAKFPLATSRASATDFSAFDDFKLINSSAIMHNKFAIFEDAQGLEYLYMGTTNATITGFESNNNNSLIFQDSSIAAIYRQQFESYLELPGSSELTSVSRVTIDGIDIDVLFAPNTLDDKSAMDHLMDLTNLADSSVHFMIFSYPHMGLNDIMLDLALNRGVDVKGIYDRSQLNNGAEEYYSQRGIPVLVDGNNLVVDGHGGKLHHKTMIIDSAQSDAVVVTGSFNWSKNANVNNDENMIFIHSSAVAAYYEEEWLRCWNEGTPVPTIEPRGDDAQPGDIIINEVLWMGSNYSENGTIAYKDEFVELLNLTNQRIDLSGWALRGSATSGKPMLFPQGTYINANSFLVIAHYSNSTDPAINSSALDLAHSIVVIDDLAITNDSAYLLQLEDQDFTVIDTVGDGETPWSSWAGYNGQNLERSMIRIASGSDGTLQASWTDSIAQENIQASEMANLYATPGADNFSGISTYNMFDVVISEIAWAVTDTSANDEWIELFNNTAANIDLTGWVISDGLDIQLQGIIPAGGFFLLERTDNDSVPGVTADQIYSGTLANSGENLFLSYNGTDIDIVVMDSGWVAGSNTTGAKLSMERINLTSSDMSTANWKNGVGDVEGAGQ